MDSIKNFLNYIKGFRTFIVFTLIGVIGMLTALESIDVAKILLPLVCHFDPATYDPAQPCSVKVLKWAGYWTAGISGLAMFLRTITSSSIFTSIFNKDK